MSAATLIFGTVLLLFVLAPLLLGSAGWWRSRREPAPPPWDVQFSLASMLLYTLAFNLTFLVQDFFLVLPKALTPGLRPTLYHNNHTWQGDNALAALFQGTGALATCAVALFCAALLRLATVRSSTARLFLIWMAYCGFFMALPQVVIGALSTGSDVGMALDYLQLSAATKLVAGFVALALLPPIALWLLRELLACSDAPATGARARGRFVFRTATVPALAALSLLVIFRVPREWLEVLFLPVVVTWFGIVWMQAGAWLMTAPLRVVRTAQQWPLRWLTVAVLLLLLVFQFVLRPGVRFY